MDFTFGIITAGNSDPFIEEIIDSIERQNIPRYEIIVVGNSSICRTNTIVILFDEVEKEAWITKKKNIITNRASFENIVYMHDYIRLQDGWYEGQKEAGDRFNIRMDRVVNNDGSRFRDWCIWPNNGNEMDAIIGNDCLIPYDISHLSRYMYISGSYWVAKKRVMLEFPLDERLSWGESEDVLWSMQVREKYEFSMNDKSSVLILKKGKDRIFGEPDEEKSSKLRLIPASKKTDEKMIKLVIFDLDGVLIDAKKIHYDTLNQAIEQAAGKQYTIELSEHLSSYDGLKTTQKLKMLTERKGLPEESHSEIWRIKQELTKESIKQLRPDEGKKELMEWLKKEGYAIACCTNSIRKTANIALAKIGVIEYADLILSNEDVKMSKPYPEIYWTAMSRLGFLPEETLIVEDSPIGLLAAFRSGAEVLRVQTTEQTCVDIVSAKLKEKNSSIMKKMKWKDERLNVIIPMAGAGTRFQMAGYTFPKPLIEVNGKPMIQVVAENLNIEANYIYIVQKEHREKYSLDTMLNLITPGCKIVETDGLTEGAACTALLAKEHIDSDAPLFFANSDQYAEWESSEFLYKMAETGCDGGIVTFKSTHPKWSFAKIDGEGFVTEVAEKNPISDNATVGFYYWKKGSDFVRYAEQMISKDIRVNNEFYVCPVFNQAIQDGKKIRTFEISGMWGLGTPEDLDRYLKSHP